MRAVASSRAGDGKSGSVFERVEIDGERYFVKRLSPSTDWIMRITGDHFHRPYVIWQAGILEPPEGRAQGREVIDEAGVLLDGHHAVAFGHQPGPDVPHDHG